MTTSAVFDRFSRVVMVSPYSCWAPCLDTEYPRCTSMVLGACSGVEIQLRAGRITVDMALEQALHARSIRAP